MGVLIYIHIQSDKKTVAFGHAKVENDDAMMYNNHKYKSIWNFLAILAYKTRHSSNNKMRFERSIKCISSAHSDVAGKIFCSGFTFSIVSHLSTNFLILIIRLNTN
jgi:hypothetical protein